ncbi:MAG: DeoR/GlpR family DNA-binding transcription regulator [Actinobacteria bacterium]|nr:DeoR/GlpR family DNA-binding transcription regulator [Actinomycetota bacterium]
MLSQRERRDKIAEIINIKGFARIDDLKEMFGVSEMTIYRDLQELENDGLLRKTIGGAIKSIDFFVGGESSFAQRLKTNWEEKRAIARKAIQMIENGDSIIIDAGSTPYALAMEISKSNLKELTAITNSVIGQLELSKNRDVKVISTGGMMRYNALSLVGSSAEKFIEKISVDRLFLSAKAITNDGRLMDPDIDESRVKELYIKSAKEVVLLADHSKFGKDALYNFASSSDVDVLITDAGTENESLNAFKEGGVQVVKAGLQLINI